LSRTRAAGLGVFALAMINVAAIVSPRNLPLTADYGWAMFFFLGASIILFLIPISLVSAELATGWPEAGGVYAWVREAFGERQGFLAVWCDWSENLAWFPTVLSFIAGSLAYVINPSLASNRWFLLVVMLSFFWGATLLNFLRIEQSAKLVAFGTIVGAILPMILIICLAAVWFAKGEASAIPFSADKLLPDFSGQQLILLGGILLTFAGVEMAGFHARETRNPKRDYPRAMLLGAVIIVTFSLLGSLAVALVVPEKQISLLSGTMQAFKDMLDAIGIGWLVKPVAIVIVLGGIAHLSPWIIGPAKGLAAVARHGYLPPALGRLSRNRIPTTGLVVQAIGGTVFSLLFLFLPNANTSYGILTAMTAQVIIVMYILMFSALVKLRYSQPGVERSYRLPGGKPGAWLICGAGVFGCAFAFVAGFFPPGDWATWDTGQKITYYAIVIGGFFVLVAPPFVVRVVKRDGWPALPDDEGEAALSPAID